jgi:anti-sigma factor ChrR (cupin superfamily)
MQISIPDALRPEDVEPIEVGPGCTRRDFPAADGIRAWIVDMEPGAQWPYEDVHEATGEQVWVVSGELIEGERRFGAGTYLGYGPNSRHQPRTESGVRLFGVNVRASQY